MTFAPPVQSVLAFAGTHSALWSSGHLKKRVIAPGRLIPWRIRFRMRADHLHAKILSVIAAADVRFFSAF